jgi:hypothetical protein
MKHVLAIFLLVSTVVFGQNKQILYGFKEIPQSLLVNPGGVVPEEQRYHFGVPLLSQFHINGGASGISVYDIFGESSVDINTRIDNKIFEMTNNDFFTATQQLEIVNFGWRKNETTYFSAGIYEEFDFIFYYPRDLAILAWEGNADYLGYEFDLGEVSTTGDLTMVYHFGMNKQMSDKLTLGARGKVYSSIASHRSTNNQGTFVTEVVEGSENIYEHRIQDVDMLVESSGYEDIIENGTGAIGRRALFGGSLGVGMDLGITYDISDNFTASASVLDLGVIFHNSATKNYRATGDYTLDGIELLFPALEDGETTFPYYNNLEDELEGEVPIDTLYNSYTQMRPLKFNASISYDMGELFRGGKCDCLDMDPGEDNELLGLQVYGIKRPKSLQMAGTLFYYRKLFEFLAGKVTYTVDPYSFSNIGLGLAVDLGRFNAYVAADNILRYGNIAKAKSISLQFGFNIKIHRF